MIRTTTELTLFAATNYSTTLFQYIITRTYYSVSAQQD